METYNNSNPLKKIIRRFSSYKKIAIAQLLSEVPFLEIIKTKFPYYFADNKKPLSLSIEFGNICNLSCQYCNVPLFKTGRKFMDDAVFHSLINNLKKSNIARVRIGCGGEATLHPKFKEYINEIRNNTKFLSIVTNGQWADPAMAEILINSRFNLIEFSMDAGGREVYERSRVGADYNLFIKNISKLKELKNQMHSNTLINMRLMIRPSTKQKAKQEIMFWKKYCDIIMPQFITKIPESDYKEDVFIASQFDKKAVPKCTLPFKDLIVKANGDVPYCQVTGSVIHREKIIAGNILSDTIEDIWEKEISKLRNCHRSRLFTSKITEYCKGCSGR